MNTINIMLVEDNPGDIVLTRNALDRCKMKVDLTVARDGEEALGLLSSGECPRPDLILLDLNLPKMDGRQALVELKKNEDLRLIPVVVLSSSKAEEDIDFAYREYCNCYIRKPLKMQEFIKIVQSIEDFWFTIVKLPHRKNV